MRASGKFRLLSREILDSVPVIGRFSSLVIYLEPQVHRWIYCLVELDRYNGIKTNNHLMKSFTKNLLIVVRVRKLEQYPGGSFSEAEASPEV